MGVLFYRRCVASFGGNASGLKSDRNGVIMNESNRFQAKFWWLFHSGLEAELL